VRLETGASVDTYEITGVLGAGGMGVVYRPHDARLKRDVAIKALPDELSCTPENVARFQREAELLATLNHSRIASIYDMAESGGSRFLVLELVEGETLSERLSRGPLPLAEALGLASQICEAVEAAHEKKVIHRDLKPANIKLTAGGKIKLLDFGLARVFKPQMGSAEPETASSLTATGQAFLGTAAYMSPEQARGKPVDQRTDIWAFGCVLFEMLTGRPAFDGETASDVIAAILERDADLDRLPMNTPEAVVSLIESCLEKDPHARLSDIGQARMIIATVCGRGNTVRRERPLKFAISVLVLTLFLCLGYLAAATRLGSFSNVSGTNWTGSLLVGGSTVAWGPRISPDGRRVAFIVMIDAQTQVALMDSQSGTWDVLTKRLEPGVRIHAAWSPDGSKVYFTRGTTEGVNIYSIPAVGGEERLVLDNAYFPEPLSDGSMLITRTNATGQPQLHRFWPDSNRIEPLPAYLSSPLDPLVPVRAFADGKEAVFFGRVMTEKGPRTPSACLHREPHVEGNAQSEFRSAGELRALAGLHGPQPLCSVRRSFGRSAPGRRNGPQRSRIASSDSHADGTLLRSGYGR